MIDIIIPAYNAHDTIEDTLHSIAMQVNKNDLQIIIVNDGGKGYGDIIQKFSQWLNIKEITCPKNLGPGYARNYGIENSNSEYLMFMDADDVLTYSYSLLLMYNIAISSKASIITSRVLEIDKISNDANGYVPKELEPNLMWLFGNLYKRSLLDKYNIRFFTTCHNEDVGFNTACSILSYCTEEDGGIATFNNGPVTYEWRWNENSVSRSLNDNFLNKMQLNVLGYIYTHLKALQRVEEKITTPPQQYIKGLMIMLFTLYQHHNLILNQENQVGLELDLAQSIETLSRYFCYKYYNFIGEIVPFSVFQEELIQHINELSEEEKNRLIIGFADFIDLMFSKPTIENFEDLQIESKLFQSKDN